MGEFKWLALLLFGLGLYELGTAHGITQAGRIWSETVDVAIAERNECAREWSEVSHAR